MRYNKAHTDKTEWHDWFAWRPVVVDEWKVGNKIVYEKAWWEIVERKKTYTLWDVWVYYRRKESS